MIIGEMENTEHYRTVEAYEDCVKRMAQLDVRINQFKKLLVVVCLLMLIICIL